MATPSPSPRVARFGGFRVDLRTGELWANGEKLNLQAQPFQVLATLIEHPGQLITREELKKRLWPADTFVDFDRSLNKAINRLREVLEDSAEHPRFIETLPRRGYRFLATVEVLPNSIAIVTPGAPAAPPAETESREPAASPTRHRSLRLLSTVFVALLVLAVAVYFSWRRFRPNPQLSAGKTMLAVLPFQNLTGDPGQEYFSDGLTEEMITALGGLQPERLGVIARTSVMQYKHGDKAVGQIGRELGVQYLLEGSVRRASDRVRIAVQLIQVADQTHLWAQEYDRNVRDVLAIENDVASRVAEAIPLELTRHEQPRSARPRAVIPEAYQAYLLGRYLWNTRTEDGYRKAIGLFEDAIQKDPGYALAYSGLADCYLVLGGYGLMPPKETIPKAREAALKALAIDPALGEGHVSLALISEDYDWDWATAEREFRRAIQLNPNLATAHHWFAEYLATVGRFDEAISEMNRALELDPVSPIIHADAGKFLWFARRYDDAIVQDRRALELQPRFSLAYIHLSLALVGKGMFDKAIAEVQHARQWDDTPFSLSALGYCYAVAGQKDQARAALAELERRSAQKQLDPSFFVRIYVGLGDKDQAFAWMEKEYLSHSDALVRARFSPIYDPVRSDPRFRDLMRRVGLPQ